MSSRPPPGRDSLSRQKSQIFFEENESDEDSFSSIEEKELVAENLREWIYFTLSKGIKFSKLAFAYQVFQNVVILLSVVNFLVSSLPRFWESELLELEVIEKLSVGIFTLDYLARFAVAEPGKRCKWVIRPLHIFDLAVIIPFYIELILKHGTDFNPADDSLLVIIRALRLFQMFRTVKIARYSSLIPVFMKALALSKDGFVLFTFTVTILMVVISASLFYAEQTVVAFDKHAREWIAPSGSLSAFQSIPGTFWWFVTTITTVGYGDSFPLSPLGKTVAAFTMIGGLFVLAVPVAVFGSNFSSVWDERSEQEKEKGRKRRKKKFQAMNEDTLINNLERRMQRFSEKLNKQKIIVHKLLEDERELLDIIFFLSRAEQENSKKQKELKSTTTE